jgi:hypothetical protein
LKICLLLGATFLAVHISIASEGGPVTFVFNPPEGVTLLKKSSRTTLTRTKETHNSPEIETDVQVSLVSFHRAPEGFLQTEVITNIYHTSHNRTYTLPLDKVFLGRKVDFVLSADGKELVEIKGEENLPQAIESVVGTNHVEDINRNFGNTANLDFEKRHWDLFVGRYIGRTITQGDAWKGERLNSGGTPYSFNATWVRSITNTAGSSIVTTFTADSNLRAVIDQIDLAKVSNEEMNKPFQNIHGGVHFDIMLSTRAFEAETMLPVSESRRSIRNEKQSGGIVVIENIQVDSYQRL